MWPVGVVVIRVLTKDGPQMPVTGDQDPVQALAAGAAGPASAIAFARGACTGVRTVRTAMALNTAPDAVVNLVSRSRIKNVRSAA